jgi:pimeloyl-ACP methyl ester carboxylesterase
MAPLPLELSFRTRDTGGEVNSAPNLTDFQQRCSSRELILLIHGFNDPITDARAAYDAFIAMQQNLANIDADGDFAPGHQVVEVFWKGDDWGILSPLYYPDAVPNAVTSGAALATVLLKLAEERCDAIEVSIVAHSLGTRVALECIKALCGSSAVEFSHIVFFAAATPTFMLEDPRESHHLRQALDHVTGASVSLYSKSDDVLALAFPPGQTISEGNEGFFPRALGHEYWDSTEPSPFVVQVNNPNAGHSDYWGWRKTHPECELRANMQAKDTLGLPAAGARASQIRVTAMRDGIDLRSTPVSAPQSFAMPVRTI